jgi:RNA polymerase sigma factor (sigma-70 family)
MQVRFQLRQRRNANLEVAAADTNAAGWMQQAADDRIGPDEAAMFAEQLEFVMGELNEEENRIIQLKLDGYGNEEIAQQLGCSERTVRRITQRIRDRLRSALLSSLSEHDQ